MNCLKKKFPAFYQCCGPGAFLTSGSWIRNRFFPDPGSQTHIFVSLMTIFGSVADLGCLSLILDSTFFPSRIRTAPSRILIKEFKYNNPIKRFVSSRKYDPCIIRYLFACEVPVLRIRIRIRIHRINVFWGLLNPDPSVRGMDPDPLVRGMDPDLDPSITKQKSKKNVDSYCFVTSFGLFIFEMMYMYLQKVISKKTFFFN